MSQIFCDLSPGVLEFYAHVWIWLHPWDTEAINDTSRITDMNTPAHEIQVLGFCFFGITQVNLVCMRVQAIDFLFSEGLMIREIGDGRVS